MAHPPWTGADATRLDERAKWEQAVTIVAGYRERHGIISADPLGPQPPADDHAQAMRRPR